MAQSLSAFVSGVLLVLAALVPIVNPLGAAPIFLSMTAGASEAIRSALAARIARNAFILLSGGIFLGSQVLLLLGLSMPVVKIAGGLLVMSTAWSLARAEHSADVSQIPARWTVLADDATGYSFTPLTFPITVGPGSLSVAVALGAGLPLRDAVRVVSTLTGALLVSVAIFLCYRFASRVMRVLGANGTVVMLRLSAFILLAVGVQILFDGLAERLVSMR